MGNVSAKGIVLRQVNYGEADRMLTVFTDEYGIIKAAARGVRRMKSRRSAAAQFLCYGEFDLYMSGGEVSTLNSVSVLDAFYPVSEDISAISLFTYFADMAMAGVGFSNPDVQILRLFLNTLYMCAYKKLNLISAKVVYELRFMATIGFVPMLGRCSACGKSENITGFDLNFGVVCEECRRKTEGCIDMPEDVYHAICYILASEEKKMFSFKASADVMRKVSNISEKYVSRHLEKNFSSLDYFKKILT